jgi:hypothetical protein
MQEGQIFVITVAAIITSGVTLSAIAQAWAQKRKSSDSKLPAQRLDSIDARLSRLEETIETVAIEMERVAEGQRFTAKLLAERTATAPQPLAPRPASPAEGRVVTPH